MPREIDPGRTKRKFVRRETGVKGWTEKRASEGDHRPPTWSKTQEEKFLVSRRREKEASKRSVDIAFPLEIIKKESSRRLQRRRVGGAG